MEERIIARESGMISKRVRGIKGESFIMHDMRKSFRSFLFPCQNNGRLKG